jgi:hypothetical protein
MIGRERTDRVSGTGITCEEESLAAAAAKVFRPAIATLARLGHPLFSAKPLKRGRLSPYPFQRVLTNIVELHARDDSSGMTRQRLARRIN